MASDHGGIPGEGRGEAGSSRWTDRDDERRAVVRIGTEERRRSAAIQSAADGAVPAPIRLLDFARSEACARRDRAMGEAPTNARRNGERKR